MSRPTSVRRCPLAALEARWEASDLPADLKALGVSLVRRVRQDTPGAPVLIRMGQSLACQVWMKAQRDGDNLMVLNRALSEWVRAMKALGCRLPGDRGGWMEPRGGRGDIFTPPRRSAGRAGDVDGEVGEQDEGTDGDAA